MTINKLVDLDRFANAIRQWDSLSREGQLTLENIAKYIAKNLSQENYMVFCQSLTEMDIPQEVRKELLTFVDQHVDFNSSRRINRNKEERIYHSAPEELKKQLPQILKSLDTNAADASSPDAMMERYKRMTEGHRKRLEEERNKLGNISRRVGESSSLRTRATEIEVDRTKELETPSAITEYMEQLSQLKLDDSSTKAEYKARMVAIHESLLKVLLNINLGNDLSKIKALIKKTKDNQALEQIAENFPKSGARGYILIIDYLNRCNDKTLKRLFTKVRNDQSLTSLKQSAYNARVSKRFLNLIDTIAKTQKPLKPEDRVANSIQAIDSAIKSLENYCDKKTRHEVYMDLEAHLHLMVKNKASIEQIYKVCQKINDKLSPKTADTRWAFANKFIQLIDNKHPSTQTVLNLLEQKRHWPAISSYMSRHLNILVQASNDKKSIPIKTEMSKLISQLKDNPQKINSLQLELRLLIKKCCPTELIRKLLPICEEIKSTINPNDSQEHEQTWKLADFALALNELDSSSAIFMLNYYTYQPLDSVLNYAHKEIARLQKGNQ